MGLFTFELKASHILIGLEDNKVNNVMLLKAFFHFVVVSHTPPRSAQCLSWTVLDGLIWLNAIKINVDTVPKQIVIKDHLKWWLNDSVGFKNVHTFPDLKDPVQSKTRSQQWRSLHLFAKGVSALCAKKAENKRKDIPTMREEYLWKGSKGHFPFPSSCISPSFSCPSATICQHTNTLLKEVVLK